ncbi:MAG: hypothetical protein FWD23_17810, partial [Oscillospiraceae bacterium]|nr:hypothetical protein [Oscillospiraceae bacterium]
MKIFIQYKKIGISAAVLMVVLAVAGLSVLSVNLSDKVKRQAVIEARADMPGIELAPPAAKPNQCCIFRGNEVKPEDFVIDVQNAARVICSFAAAPDVFSPGWQEVAVILTDENQNSAEIHSGLYVFDFTDELVMEAGAAESAAAKDFIRNYMELEDLSLDIEADGVDFAKLGTYPVVLKMGQRQTASAVKIEDTTPPSAKPNQCRIFRGNEVEPEDFVGDIQDATRVICSFAAAPDVFSPGWQEAAVILTDESQNSAEIKSELYVFDFTEELVIEAGTAKSVAAKDFIRNYMETDE